VDSAVLTFDSQPVPRRAPTQRFNLIRAADGWLGHDRLWSAAVLAIALLQLALIWTHTPWLDEWQALQLALQSPDIPALLGNLRYEGHPPLWYLLLRGAAAVMPPAFVLPAVQTVIALALQALILFRAPVTRLERLLIATSFFLLFDYGTLSRSLSLGVLLTTAAFAFRRHPLGWAAVALLPFADFLFGVLSMICVALRLRDRDVSIPGLAAWGLCGLLSAISVIPAKDTIPALWLNGLPADAYLFVTRLSVLLVPLHGPQYGLQWNQPLPEAIGIVAGPLFLMLGSRLTRAVPLHHALYLGFAALLFAFSVTVYPLAIRHLSLLAMLVILLRWWTPKAQRADSAGLFRGWMAVASLCGLITAGVSFARPFDTAGEAAAYIRDGHLEDKHWLVFPDSRAQGVSALTGVEFTRLEKDCAQSFIRWDHRATINSQKQLDAELRRATEKFGRSYLLTDFAMQAGHDPRLYRLLRHVPAGYDGQAYYLWMVAPYLPERSARPPQCAPTPRLPLKVG
jgi:hypothetical protein